jgi:uncharacterized protein (TIGR02118 family)
VIKTITIAHRNPNMTHEEFSKHWLEVHGPLAAKLIPYVKRYVQNHFVKVPGMEFQGDGVVELWFDSVEAWQESQKVIHQTPALIEDGKKFCAMKPGGVWVVEERVILDKTKK